MSEEKKNLSSGQRERLKNLLDGVDEQPEPEVTADDTAGGGEYADFQVTPGDMVGPFKILSVIGRGGFGVVFLAEQTAPVKRRVALKVIKAGMDTDAIVARFEAERQALALMNHPAIARVYEAGATNQGRPYFAMEYVKGDPLTEYCDTHKLDMRTRLELFAEVCDAIRHAHLKGIIHRDLKPGNILVTVDDHDEPHPKVIDFGIAKATSQQLTERTLFTQQGQIIGTPEFMSPEQAEMTGVDVDTRTDVYSLGVILYVLVSGHLPFDSKRLRERGFAEIQRIIREEDPPRPSTRLTSASKADDENTRRIAKARQTSIESLSSTLRRELEWIPLKALRKNRTERYSSVEALGEDVRRYLRGDALEAGPETTLYRFRKMVRRNKGPFIAAALVVLSLLAGIIGVTIFAVESTRQTRIADQQRTIAEEKTAEARASEQEAQRQRDAALQQAYLGNINAAAAAVTGGVMADARRRLDAARAAMGTVPPEELPFEWQYLNAQTDDAMMPMYSLGGFPRAVAFSPDNTLVASGAGDVISLWDRATGEELMVLRGHERAVDSIAFSPDSTRLASGGDSKICLWDTKTGKELAVLPGHVTSTASLSFSPDGTLLGSSGFDDTVRLWDAQTGEQLHVLKPNPGRDGVFRLQSFAFSPDGTRVAITSYDRNIHLFETATGELSTILRGHTSNVQQVAFSPDGTRLVSGSNDTTIRLWDTTSGEAIRILRGHDAHVHSVAFSPDGTRLASGGFDGTIRLWDTATGEELRILRGHENQVLTVMFTPDSTLLVSNGDDETIRLWDVATGEEVDILYGHVGAARSLAMSPDGTLLVSYAYGDDAIRLWNIATGEQGKSLYTYESGGQPIAFSPDGTLFASASSVGSYRRIHLLDTATGEVLSTLTSTVSWGLISALAFSPDSALLASSVSGSKSGTIIELWDTASGRLLSSMRAGPGEYPDRRRQGVWSDSTPVGTGLSFNADGTSLAVGVSRGMISVLDIASGEELMVLRGSERPGQSYHFIRSIAFSPDGTLLASGGFDKTIRLWDSATGEELHVLRGHEGYLNQITFSHDSSLLASGGSIGDVSIRGDSIVRLWDTATGEELRLLHGHEGSIEAVAFNPDSTRLASSDWHGSIRFWDVATGKEVMALRGVEGSARSLVFSPDGNRLASAGSLSGQFSHLSKSAVRFWDTRSRGEIIRSRRLARQRAAELTPVLEEWMVKAGGDSDVLLDLLDRDTAHRSHEEATTLRNLVHKALEPDRHVSYFSREVELGWNNAPYLNKITWNAAISDDTAFFAAVSNEALRAAQRACELTEYTYAVYLDTLARVHFERGETDDALKWQETAIEHLQEGADDAEYLAALKRYRAAAALDPNAPEEAAANAEP